mmetsp:Transcript_30247/g.86701  ORF Transcript_30247/g.86701 Transcript_30247/m.86701 type:complete len:293 (+) Transcript_30247:162-1040(+)
MSLPASEQQAPPSQHYAHATAAALAGMASDHGRKVHELPWLYLDSVGQEYGPVPGWTMREWLTLGRFPVGRDLRVRLPEWEQHLPLHQLFPDLSTAFVLPPAWPNIYVDDVLQGEDHDSHAALLAASRRQRPSAASASAESSTAEAECMAMGGHSPCSMVADGRGALGSSGSAASSSQEMAGRWVSLPRLWMAGMNTQQRPVHRDRQQFPQERLVLPQEDPILPPPPPQPSQQQLREMLSQPQEGPLFWEDDQAYSYHCIGVQQVGSSMFISTGPYHAGDVVCAVGPLTLGS